MPVLNWLRAEGFAVLVLSVLLYSRAGASWWVFGALVLTPDISMLPYLISTRAGAVSYNLAHNYVFPLLLLAAAILLRWNSVVPYVWIWTAHIGMDRMMGYGLKYATGFGKTHLVSKI